MRKIITISMLAAALCGCTDGDISKARSELKRKLYDGDSAQFRNEQVYRVDGITTVCGEVNAKNRMGGYTGFQPFAVAAGVTVNIGASATLDCQFAEVNSRLKK
ncbi:hypothetical protein ACFSKY_00215 [Azotobacter chroococcum]|uniref:Uncharacterized protein n=1 Tax=Azotobacter chroococcum TaxID=353 RepID=A0A4R1PS19_9GAMM|nr:hypothetical protein [Azotobacter chroococcum]TBV95977.1 hypothetical protein E0E53_12280 [Azotobacter chroococcum]TCL26803.1 hypothetical protein EV691_1298 [Azotobacter chroococcum]